MKHLKKWIWLMLISVLLSACGGTAAAAPVPTPSSCDIGNNIYASDQVEPRLVNIYEYAVTVSGDAAAYNAQRQLAFSELVNQVYSLSDSVDIGLEEKTVRITITYISPQFAHAIIVNHYLYKRNLGFAGRLSDQVKGQISGIIARNEHVFFITFMAFDNTTNTIDNSSIAISLPVQDLELTNTNNSIVLKQHDDHNLENTIVLNNGPEYGFLYYPMAVLQRGACQAVLDKNRDTRIVLRVPNITINDNDVGPRSWKYKYAPLINVRMESLTPTPIFPVTISLSFDQLTPQSPEFMPKDLNDPGFWIALSRMIWLETTLDP